MIFKRKVYDELLEWKNKYADKYAVLLEGPRRVGKTTIAMEFAKKEYKSYLCINFSAVSNKVLSCFSDIGNLDLFFLRIQSTTGVKLFKHNSLIIFDEVQLFPKARQAIKQLANDGRYHYLETGSLISIGKNVKDILIPSEEMKIQVYPMDFEEFCLATNKDYELIRELCSKEIQLGQNAIRNILRDIRIYMAVGGMPQAVESYVDGNNFEEIDNVKRGIIRLYEDDFKKLDSSGRLSAFFHAIPAILSSNKKRFYISSVLNRRKRIGDEKLIYDLIDSKTVIPSYNTTDPRISLSLTKDLDSYKLYLADTGLFVTLMFIDRPSVKNELYSKLLSDKLPANLGYLYENLIAQIIFSTNRELYYHTWKKKNSTHNYEVDFLVGINGKIMSLEVKSSKPGSCESIIEFDKEYSKILQKGVVLYPGDFNKKDGLEFKPIFSLPFLIEK